jgi:hypothetical protein
MIHDSLCPNIDERYDPETAILWPRICHCGLIKKIRDAERYRIVAAVGRLSNEGHWDLGIGPVITAIMDQR